jgi:membrane-bound metal-dependent hydrolase YbcI (DUF457 family)
VIIGHYAASLVPHAVLGPRCPYWLLLLCSQVPEFLWLILSLAGVERPHPDSVLDATFQNLTVSMTYSHNLVPAVAQAAVVGAVVWLATRKHDVAAWCAALVVVHVLCDYLVGFEHELLGPTSPAVALNSYGRFPHAAVIFELVWSLALVRAYQVTAARRGRPLARWRRNALYASFAAGVALWLPAATRPLRAMFE